MAEYIKREDAIKSFLDADTDIMADYGPDYGIECGFSRDRVKEILDSLLAADVAEVRHGRWILIRRQAASAIFKCSECGREELFDAYHRLENTPYCHCGARMDKEDENEVSES